ncbi:MAG: hypothetical protein H6656_10995 [Ardenticatenaceae bacterium]|nr:hypothetical protein [Ardenticatenaceae bacterium]
MATQECYLQAVHDGADTAVTLPGRRLLRHPGGTELQQNARRVRRVPHRSLLAHALGQRARQPGMTGQVKEEILTRWGELGVSLRDGQLCFAPTLLRPDEFLTAPDSFAYVDVTGQNQSVPLPAGSLAFTFCQTPIVYTLGDEGQIEVVEEQPLPHQPLQQTRSPNDPTHYQPRRTDQTGACRRLARPKGLTPKVRLP